MIMTEPVILVSIPGLCGSDLAHMPNLAALAEQGGTATLVPSFPCVTWPVQSAMLTGKSPREHGVVANGFYWRDKREVEMWTAWNDKITAPQIWDRLHELDPPRTSAVWFPMLSKGCGADWICMPAPIHNPDGSESLWCYTRPTELYGVLRDSFGHFPLQHFWGPIANINSSKWIADSALYAAEQFHPEFFFVYLPHLDYAAQRTGPDSPPAIAALAELDTLLGRLVDGLSSAYAPRRPLLLAASEYVITPVDHVSFPNRALREAGLLAVRREDDGEHLDLETSRAWALVDHQFSHVFVRDADAETIAKVRRLFENAEGIAEVLVGPDRAKYQIDHERSGEVILISTPESWQAYYWWLDDANAPGFARTVDIHRKPGFDPVELHFDPATKSIPLDASRVKGSHGIPATSPARQSILVSSSADALSKRKYADTEVFTLVMEQFG
jgi:hypothetical protein